MMWKNHTSISGKWSALLKYPVAQDFERIYTYLSQRLIEANVKKDKEILEEVNEHLRTTRDTWKEVMKKGRE